MRFIISMDRQVPGGKAEQSYGMSHPTFASLKILVEIANLNSYYIKSGKLDDLWVISHSYSWLKCIPLKYGSFEKSKVAE